MMLVMKVEESVNYRNVLSIYHHNIMNRIQNNFELNYQQYLERWDETEIRWQWLRLHAVHAFF